MREEILRRFFEGAAEATDLARDLQGALAPDGPGMTRHPIVDMAEEFEVRPIHLVKVCDAVLDGSVQAELLEAIGFCLVASDTFHWDTDSPAGERVADVACDWSAPEINYPLTLPNVAAWRRRLLGEEARFETKRPVA
jgi:hypothetical protein